MHPDHGSVERVVVETQYSSVFCKPFIPWTKPNSDSGPCPECRLPAHPMVSLLPNTTIQVVVLVVQDKQTPQAKRYQVCTEAKTTKPIQDVCTGGPQRPGNETEREKVSRCVAPHPPNANAVNASSSSSNHSYKPQFCQVTSHDIVARPPVLAGRPGRVVALVARVSVPREAAVAAVVPDFVLKQRARLGHEEVAGPRGARGVGALRGRGEADGRHLGLAGEEDAEHGDGLGDDGDGGLEEVEDGHEDHEVWAC